MTIRIPIRLQRRGDRKLIMTSEGSAVPTLKPRRDDTLIKALVRAPVAASDRERECEVDHRPRRAGGVTDAYVCRLLLLTCLAPNIVAAILHGLQRRG